MKFHFDLHSIFFFEPPISQAVKDQPVLPSAHADTHNSGSNARAQVKAEKRRKNEKEVVLFV